jgi:flagellar motor switch protein FliN
MSDMSNLPTGAPRGAGTDPDLRMAPNFDLLASVPLRVSVEVGSTALPLADLVTLGEGSVIELDRSVTDLFDILANGTLVARGEVVSVGDSYGIKIAEIVAAERRLDGLERRK